MKCHCGFEEVCSEEVKLPVNYKRGARKGQLKSYSSDYIYGTYMEELSFGIGSSNITLKVCPECGLVYKDGYYS